MVQKYVVILAVCAVLGCRDRSTPKSTTPGPTTAEMSQKTMPAQDPTCDNMKSLIEHEGKRVFFEGRFSYPKTAAFATNKLILSDGTSLMLPPSQGELEALFSAKQDGAMMRMSGIAYYRNIPERYKVIGRTTDPYLFEVERVEINPAVRSR